MSAVPDDVREAWARLRAERGDRATAVDLYGLVAAARGVRPEDLPADERLALGRAAVADQWTGFELTTGSGRSPEPIALVEPDPAWAARFASWAADIRAALGGTALRVDHVGSTSVPGLVAKPVVDIQVSVPDLAAEQHYVPQLEGLHLQLRSRDDQHRYLRPVPEQPRDVHVHVCRAGSTWERDHLAFRDRLRADPTARLRYAAAKRHAAELWRDDMIAYTAAKTEAVLEILRG